MTHVQSEGAPGRIRLDMYVKKAVRTDFRDRPQMSLGRKQSRKSGKLMDRENGVSSPRLAGMLVKIKAFHLREQWFQGSSFGEGATSARVALSQGCIEAVRLPSDSQVFELGRIKTRRNVGLGFANYPSLESRTLSTWRASKYSMYP